MDEPIYSEQELKAYHEGREAKKAGKDYFECPYPYDRRRTNPLKWAWGEGWMDEEDGVSLEFRLEATRNGAAV